MATLPDDPLNPLRRPQGQAAGVPASAWLPEEDDGSADVPDAPEIASSIEAKRADALAKVRVDPRVTAGLFDADGDPVQRLGAYVAEKGRVERDQAEVNSNFDERVAIAEQKQAARDAKAAEIQSRREHNSGARGQERETGQQFVADESGRLQPVIDPVTQKPKFTPNVSPVRYDERTGAPFQVRRDEQGTQTVENPDANAPIGRNPDDPTDRTLYRQNKEKAWDVIDPEVAVHSSDPRVAVEAGKHLHGLAVKDVSSKLADVDLQLSDPAKKSVRLTDKERAKEEKTVAALENDPDPASQQLLAEAKAKIAGDDEIRGLQQQAFDLKTQKRDLEKLGPGGFLQKLRADESGRLASLPDDKFQEEAQAKASDVKAQVAQVATQRIPITARIDEIDKKMASGVTGGEQIRLVAERQALISQDSALIDQHNAAVAKINDVSEAEKIRSEKRKSADALERQRQLKENPDLAPVFEKQDELSSEIEARKAKISQMTDGPDKQQALELATEDFKKKSDKINQTAKSVLQARQDKESDLNARARARIEAESGIYMGNAMAGTMNAFAGTGMQSAMAGHESDLTKASKVKLAEIDSAPDSEAVKKRAGQLLDDDKKLKFSGGEGYQVLHDGAIAINPVSFQPDGLRPDGIDSWEKQIDKAKSDGKLDDKRAEAMRRQYASQAEQIRYDVISETLNNSAFDSWLLKNDPQMAMMRDQSLLSIEGQKAIRDKAAEFLKEHPTALEWTGDKFSRFAMSTVPQMVGDTSSALGVVANIGGIKPNSVGNFLQDYGAGIDEIRKEMQDPRMANDTTGKFVEGMGSSIGFMLPAAYVGRVAKGIGLGERAVELLSTATVAAVGAGQNAGQVYKEARAAGLSEQDAALPMVLGGIIGLSEITPLGEMLNRMGGPIKGGFRKALNEAFSETIEEVIQNTGQQIAGNAVAQAIYDKHRDIFDGAGEAAWMGGGSAAILSALTSAVVGVRSIRLRSKYGAGKNVDIENLYQADAEIRQAGSNSIPDAKTIQKQRETLIAQLQSEDDPTRKEAIGAQVSAMDDYLRVAPVNVPRESRQDLARAMVKIAQGVPLEKLSDAERTIVAKAQTSAGVKFVEDEGGTPIITDNAREWLRGVSPKADELIGMDAATAREAAKTRNANSEPLQPEPVTSDAGPTNVDTNQPEGGGTNEQKQTETEKGQQGRDENGRQEVLSTWSATGRNGTEVSVSAGSRSDAIKKLASKLPQGEMLDPDTINETPAKQNAPVSKGTSPAPQQQGAPADQGGKNPPASGSDSPPAGNTDVKSVTKEKTSPEKAPRRTISNRDRWKGQPVSKPVKLATVILTNKGVKPQVAETFARQWVEKNPDKSVPQSQSEILQAFRDAGGKLKGESTAANYNTDEEYWKANGQSPMEAAQSAKNARAHKAKDDSAADLANEALAKKILDGKSPVVGEEPSPYGESDESLRGRGVSSPAEAGAGGLENQETGGNQPDRPPEAGGSVQGAGGAVGENIASGEEPSPASSGEPVGRVARRGEAADVDRGIESAGAWVGKLNSALGLSGDRAVNLVVDTTGKSPYAFMGEDGKISILIDPKSALSNMNIRFDEDGGDGPEWLNSAMGEEQIHVADFLSGREKWEAAGKPDGAMEFWKSERQKDINILLAALSGPGGENIANAVVHGILAYDALGKEISGEAMASRISNLPGDTIIEKAKNLLNDSRNGLGLYDNTKKTQLWNWRVVSEVLREITQVRRAGDITEQKYRGIVGRLLDWMRGVTKYLKAAGEHPVIKEMLRRIEEILNFADGGEDPGTKSRPPPENPPESSKSPVSGSDVASYGKGDENGIGDGAGVQPVGEPVRSGDVEDQSGDVLEGVSPGGPGTEPAAPPATAGGGSAPVPVGEHGEATSKQLPPPKFSVTGEKTVAYTDGNEPVEAKWAVADIGDLVISNEDTGRVNPYYPQELQPRDRSSSGSQMQVDDIAKNANFDRLSVSDSVGNGAPFVGPEDGVVESGNGRLMGLRRAYERGLPSIEAYREKLIANAGKFGLDPEAIKAVKKPVLIRVRETLLDRKKFAEVANVSNVAPMREMEVAKKDASNITPDLVSLFNPSDEGDIFGSQNQDFILAFIKNVVPQGERPAIIDSRGNLSQTGVRRIRNAIFSYAYGSTPEAMNALGRMTESVDAEGKNLTNAMLAAAPKFAEQAAKIKSGALYDLPITGDLLAAAQEIVDIRNRGEKIGDALAQQELFGSRITQFQKELIAFLDKNARSGKRITETLRRYAAALEGMGNPQQAGFFESEKPTKEGLWNLAKQPPPQTILSSGDRRQSPQAWAKAYNKLFALQRAGEKLTPGQQLTMNRAERELGQSLMFDEPHQDPAEFEREGLERTIGNLGKQIRDDIANLQSHLRNLTGQQIADEKRRIFGFQKELVGLKKRLAELPEKSGSAPKPDDGQMALFSGSRREWGKYDLSRVQLGQDIAAAWRNFPRSETEIPELPEGDPKDIAEKYLKEQPRFVSSAFGKQVVLHKVGDVKGRSQHYVAGNARIFAAEPNRVRVLAMLANTVRNAMAYASAGQKGRFAYLYRYSDGTLHVVIVQNVAGGQEIERQFTVTQYDHDPSRQTSPIRILRKNGAGPQPSATPEPAVSQEIGSSTAAATPKPIRQEGGPVNEKSETAEQVLSGGTGKALRADSAAVSDATIRDLGYPINENPDALHSAGRRDFNQQLLDLLTPDQLAKKQEGNLFQWAGEKKPEIQAQEPEQATAAKTEPEAPPAAPPAAPQEQKTAIPEKTEPQSSPSRSKPTEQIVFKTPYRGPSGAEVTAYQWKYKVIGEIDKRGEEISKRISDWDESEASDESGRLIVHQFAVKLQNGETRLTSLEGAMRMLGYAQGDVRSAGIKTLASALKTRAKLQMEYDRAKQQSDKFQEKQEAAAKIAATLPDPEFTDEGAWANGDAMRIQQADNEHNFQVYYPRERDAREKAIKTVVETAKYKAAVSQLPEEIRSAAPIPYGKLDDLKIRIERADKKLGKLYSENQTQEKPESPENSSVPTEPGKPVDLFGESLESKKITGQAGTAFKPRNIVEGFMSPDFVYNIQNSTPVPEGRKLIASRIYERKIRGWHHLWRLNVIENAEGERYAMVENGLDRQGNANFATTEFKEVPQNDLDLSALEPVRNAGRDIWEENRKPKEPAAKTVDVSDKPSSQPGELTDFGTKLGGARKDQSASLAKEYSDDDIAGRTLSEIWPKSEVDAIEDTQLAAVAHAVRSEVPAKPRKGYKLSRWVETVKLVRGLMRHAEEKGFDEILRLMEEKRLEQFTSKIRLLSAIPRAAWDRVGEVRNYPNAYRYVTDENGKSVFGADGKMKTEPTPFAMADVDGRHVRADNLTDLAEKVTAATAEEKASPKMQFEVRGRGDVWGINKKGDPLYRKLKTFTDSKAALDFVRSNHGDLVKAWEDVKERENVKERDLRTDSNRPRTGSDRRNGRDVTPELFQQAFGFRGVEFGNWVAQGGNAKERQGMLNDAFDALHDLADIVGIPPRAVSLDGQLGLGFGSRGKGGFAAAHYEPGTIVINLTKTKGAGTLAHEWFHALDHYFQRQRNERGIVGRNGDYITNNPETYFEGPNGQRLPESRYNELMARPYNASRLLDWKRVEGVRPEVAEAFNDLVKALDESPMAKRAKLIDAGKSDGYWGRTIERAARSFENYTIFKMAQQGYHNDYLANVVKADDFSRDLGRYPYLLDSEMKPVAEAFDNLFGTIHTRDTENGVELYSGSRNGQDLMDLGMYSNPGELDFNKAAAEPPKTPGELVKENLGLAGAIAAKYFNVPGVENEDVIQQARKGLIQAARAFDPAKGKFASFAWRVMQNELNSLYGRQMDVAQNESISLDEPVGRDSQGNDATRHDLMPDRTERGPLGIEREETGDILKQAVDSLPEKPREIVRLSMQGIDGNEIASKLGISRQRVNFVLGNAHEVLRKKLTEQGLRGQEGGILYSGDRSAEQDIDDLMAEIRKDMPSLAEIESMRQRANGEVEGARTIGRPEKAKYSSDTTTRRATDVIQQLREDRMARETEDGWISEAEDMLARDKAGVKRTLLQKALDPAKYGTFTAAEVKAAQILVPELMRRAFKEKSLSLRKEAFALAWAYDAGGTAQARAFSARRDPFKTPAERHTEFLTKIISTPTAEQRKDIESAPTPEERKSRLESAQNERLDKIEKALADMGVKLEDIFSGEAYVRLKGVAMVENAMGAYDAKKRKALRLIQDQFPDNEISRVTGLSIPEINALEKEFMAKLSARLDELGDDALDLKNFDVEALFSSAPDIGVKLTASEREARKTEILKAMGFGRAESRNKKELIKRRKAKRSYPAQSYSGPSPSDDPVKAEKLRQQGLEWDENRKAWNRNPKVPGNEPLPSESMKQDRIRYDTDQPWEYVKFDPASKDQVVRAARIMQAADSNVFDMIIEGWMNGLLSGPATHVANITGNGAMAMLEYSFQRWTEAAVNTLVKDPNSATFGELKHIYRSAMPGIMKGYQAALRAFASEHDFFENDVLNSQLEFKDFDKGGGGKAAIPGKIGRVVRVMTRSLMAMDAFFKYATGQMEVAGQAYRIAMAQGLTGEAMEAEMRSQINMPGSMAWQRAVLKAKELTFQQEVPGIVKGIMALREGREAKILNKTVSGWDFPGNQLFYTWLKMQLPFIKTVYNVFRTGIRKSPVGALNMGYQTAKGLYALKNGRPFVDGYAKAMFVRDVSEQILAFGATAFLMGAIEGDDDDDKKWLLITGGRPYGVDNQGERDLLDRTHGGQYQIRIGGRNGFYFNYGRVEPWATTLGTVATGVRLAKSGKGPEDWIDRMIANLSSQATDKTFMQSVNNMFGAIDALRSKDGASKFAQKSVQGFLSSFVPNIIKQPLRNWDDYVRDGKYSDKEYKFIPIGNLAEPRSNLYGKPVQKQGNAVSRLFFPAGIVPTPVLERGDQFLKSYNRVAEKPYTPERPSVYKLKNARDQWVDMTPHQIAEFDRKSGILFALKLKTWLTPYVISHPTEEHKKQFEKDLSEARAEIKGRMHPVSAK
ncbi:MAG: sigma-70 family RNA polymerase sigma factor [Verrucomicrobiae bacterium]